MLLLWYSLLCFLFCFVIHAISQQQCRMKLRFQIFIQTFIVCVRAEFYIDSAEHHRHDKSTEWKKRHTPNTNIIVTDKTIYFDEPNWFCTASPFILQRIVYRFEICWLILFLYSALIWNSFHVISVSSNTAFFRAAALFCFSFIFFFLSPACGYESLFSELRVQYYRHEKKSSEQKNPEKRHYTQKSYESTSFWKWKKSKKYFCLDSVVVYCSAADVFSLFLHIKNCSVETFFDRTLFKAIDNAKRVTINKLKMRKIVQNSLFYEFFFFSSSSSSSSLSFVYAVFFLYIFFINVCLSVCVSLSPSACFFFFLLKQRESCCNELLPGLEHLTKLLTFMIVFVSRHFSCVCAWMRAYGCMAFSFSCQLSSFQRFQVCRIDAVNVIINIFYGKKVENANSNEH